MPVDVIASGSEAIQGYFQDSGLLRRCAVRNDDRVSVRLTSVELSPALAKLRFAWGRGRSNGRRATTGA